MVIISPLIPVAPIEIMPCRSCIALRLKMIGSSNWKRNEKNTKDLRYLRISYRPLPKNFQIHQPYATIRGSPPRSAIFAAGLRMDLCLENWALKISQIWTVSHFKIKFKMNKFAVAVLDQVASTRKHAEMLKAFSGLAERVIHLTISDPPLSITMAAFLTVWFPNYIPIRP